MKNVMTTPFGTFLKGFISIMLSLWLVELSNGHDLFSMDMVMVKKISTGAIVANLPVLINWLNPSYTLYGKGKIDNVNNDGDDDISNQSGLITAIVFFIALSALVSACNP